MWKNFLYDLEKKWYKTNFLVSNNYYENMLDFSIKNWIKTFNLIKPIDNYFYKNLIEVKSKLEKIDLEIVKKLKEKFKI